MATEAVAPAAGPALIKRLAACNACTRSKTLKSLMSWLQHLPPTSSDSHLSEEDMKRLWKGLFYCVWHCDKAINQANLIDRLSSLLLSLPQPLSLLYLSHFLLTLRREWPGIDRLRLDKFYLMIRVFIRKLFALLKRESWVLETVEPYVGVLEESLFTVSDVTKSSISGLGDGVAYQVVSVFCDEIKHFLPLKVVVLKLLFGPFVRVMARTDNKVLLGKLRADMFDCILSNGKGLSVVRKSGEEVDSKDERMLLGTVAFLMGFSQLFYDLGSSSDCIQGNRKVLFGLHEEFLKLEKELKSSGVDVALLVNDYNDEDGDGGHGDDKEVPQLVPISNGVDNKHSKKRKGKDASKGEKDKKKKKKKYKGDGSKTNKNDEKVASLTETNNDDDDPQRSTAAEDNVVNEEEDPSDDVDSPKLDGSVLSNLQKQFEKIAAEAGMSNGVSSSLDSPKSQANGDISKKRKRAKNAKGKKLLDLEPGDQGEIDPDDNDAAKTVGEKSAKRVKFSMKNNLVWKPHNPLPPQSLRLPPSATPRGSALKKGVRPGPVRETSSGSAKAKRKSPLQNGRRGVRSVTPAMKRKKKLKSGSA